MALYYYERMPPYKPGLGEAISRFIAAIVSGVLVAGLAAVFFVLAAPFLLVLAIAVGLGLLGALFTGDYVSLTTTSSATTELDGRGVPHTNAQQHSWVRTNNPELRRQLEQWSVEDPNRPKP
jgi:hypothetical protein